MHYSLAYMTNAIGNQCISLDKNGNKYSVCFCDRETRVNEIKNFDKLDDAEKAFQKMVSLFIRCLYSAEDRAKLLKEM